LYPVEDMNPNKGTDRERRDYRISVESKKVRMKKVLTSKLEESSTSESKFPKRAHASTNPRLPSSFLHSQRQLHRLQNYRDGTYFSHMLLASHS